MIKHEFEVKGTWAYGASRLSKKKALRAGMEVKLRREPDNNYDRNAVIVYRKRSKLGYLPADLAVKVAKYLDSGGTYSGSITMARQTTRNGSKYPIVYAFVIFDNLFPVNFNLPAKESKPSDLSFNTAPAPPPLLAFKAVSQSENWRQFNCTFCNTNLEVRNRYSRTEVECPACMMTFFMPP
jgi:hypothetical protein